MLLKERREISTRPLQRYRVLSFVVQRQKVTLHDVVSVCLNTQINLEELKRKTERAQVLSLFLLALGPQAWLQSAPVLWRAHNWSSFWSFQEEGLEALAQGPLSRCRDKTWALCRPEPPPKCRCQGESVLLSWDRRTDGWTRPRWIPFRAVLGEVSFLAVRTAVDGAPAGRPVCRSSSCDYNKAAGLQSGKEAQAPGID